MRNWKNIATASKFRHKNSLSSHLIKGESLGHYEDYARLDNIADPDFIEAKGYVYVGNSRSNHTIENMPSHDEIMEFSRTLAPMVAGMFFPIGEKVEWH